MNFKIIDKEGINYSKVSGDNNLIHLKNLEGYNSIFGEKICHGCLVVIKFFKIIKINNFLKKKKKLSIKINFKKHVSYNQNIVIKKKKNNYSLIQNNKQVVEIKILNKNNLEKIDYNKKFCTIDIKKKFIVSDKNKNFINALFPALNNLTKYVGTINPGKHSMISEININYNNEFNFDRKKTEIFTRQVDKRVPIINNKLLYHNFIIEFKSLKRPILKKKKNFLKKHLIKNIDKLKNNALIIGASQGLGSDILEILTYNKKIFKIGSYNKNSFIRKNSKIISRKIDVNKDIKKINSIVQHFSPITIYYFASPKIYFENNLNTKTIMEYEKLFIKIPIDIILKNKDKKISFFYPSTTNINYNQSATYSKIKLNAEKKIQKTCKKFRIPHKIFRFPAINSRQSLSIINNDLPDLIQFFNSNKNLVHKVFL